MSAVGDEAFSALTDGIALFRNTPDKLEAGGENISRAAGGATSALANGFVLFLAPEATEVNRKVK